MTFSNLLVFFIIDWFVAFWRVRVQQSEINWGCFSLMEVIVDAGGKSFGETRNFGLFHLPILYLLYIEFLSLLILLIIFSSMSLSIWSCKKSFAILWYYSILDISINILFVLACCLHKCQILLIAKNTLLLKALTSKSGTVSDVIVTVYLNK